MTIAFLGEITSAQLALARSVPPIRVGPFELRLDALGIWPESRILWFAPLSPPEALSELMTRLWNGLERQGFRAEERVYRPHMTLARRARPTDAAATPVRWLVEEIALVESFRGGRSVHYEVLERWPL